MRDKQHHITQVSNADAAVHEHGSLLTTGKREVARLISTAPMQRLCTIAQLGFVDRVWPAASHTRLMHSVGSYDLARQAITQLRSPLFSQKRALFSPTQEQTFLVAALLHDIGHYPFSHSLDGLASLLPSHEQVGRVLIEQSTLASILEREYHLSPACVADLIDPPQRARQACAEGDALLHQLLTGACDVDKLDYVARDARACSMASGPLLCRKLCQALCVAWPENSCEPRLALASEALDSLRAWILLRHRLYVQVYWHPTNRAYGTMLARAVQDALNVEALSATHLQQTDDAGLLAFLLTEAMPESTRLLARSMYAEHPYQPVLEITLQEISLLPSVLQLAHDAQRRKRVEQQLAHHLTGVLGVPIAEHEVLLDLVHPKQWDLDGWIVYCQQPAGMATCVPWSQALALTSEDLARTAQHHCPTRILAAPHLQLLLQAQARASLLAALEDGMS